MIIYFRSLLYSHSYFFKHKFLKLNLLLIYFIVSMNNNYFYPHLIVFYLITNLNSPFIAVNFIFNNFCGHCCFDVESY